MFLAVFLISGFVFSWYVILTSNYRKSKKKSVEKKTSSNSSKVEKTTMYKNGPLMKVELDLQREISAFQKKKKFTNRRNRLKNNFKRGVKRVKKAPRQQIRPA